MFGYLNIDFKVRFPIILLDSAVYSVCGVFYEAGQPENYEEMYAKVKQKPFLVFYLFFAIQIFSHLFHMYMLRSIHGRLFSLYERHQVQAEQHMILHNLDSAIITTSGDAIKYFNDSAKQILHKAVDEIQDEDEKAKCNTEVRQIDKAIRSLKNTSIDCERKIQLRQKILQTKVFREYDRTKHNDPRMQLGESFSLQQLFQMDRQLLQSKTFVFVADRDG